MTFAAAGTDQPMTDSEKTCAECERTDGSEGCPFCGETGRDRVVTATGEPPAQATSGRRGLILMALAIVGSGAITMAALSSGSRNELPETPAAASPAPAAASGSPSGSEVELPSAGWVENRDVWLGGARKGIALEMAARNETPIWMRTVRPVLVVRCVDSRAEVFVFTDSAAAMEPQDGDHTVRIAFDGGRERSERWPDSASHDALFAPDGARLLDELGHAQAFNFGYTPHNTAPVVARFDVAGLRERLGTAARHCQP
jgi:hypothetical protein